MRQLQLSMYLLTGLAQHTSATAVTLSIPVHPPQNAASLDATPVGASFEFFMWPSYMTNITLTAPCFNHFSDLYGTKMPIRIGGTTQDRASYDPSLDAYVSYHVDDPLEAPMTLTYGPSFFDLIASNGAQTILGFNRGDNNQTNSFQAVMEAKKRASNHLWAVELGNEPDLYYYIWNKPVATPPWNATQESQNAVDWAEAFIELWGDPSPILSAGAYGFLLPSNPEWPNTQALIAASNDSVRNATKMYCTHLYSHENSTLDLEMSHMKTVNDLQPYVQEIESVKSLGRPYILGETNFHDSDYEMDAMFGAALQTLDKTLRALSLGVKQLYYHQGTIDQAHFNWLLSNQVNTPFYGGYFAALAVAGADHIVAIDQGTDLYAQYVIFKNGKPSRVVLINTDYYSGTGKRSQRQFLLGGLATAQVKALRMTASSSNVVSTLAQRNPAREPTFGGQYFSNKDCSIRGYQKLERTTVRNGQVEVVLAASEALLVYL